MPGRQRHRGARAERRGHAISLPTISDVDTHDGVVTLTGEVRSREERDQALKLARDTAGVKDVIDKMTIRP